MKFSTLSLIAGIASVESFQGSLINVSPRQQQQLLPSTCPVTTGSAWKVAAKRQQTKARLAASSSTSIEKDEATTTTTSSSQNENFSPHEVSKLTFRQLQAECKSRGLPAIGTTGTLRKRLLESLAPKHSEEEMSSSSEEHVNDRIMTSGIKFVDVSDENAEFDAALALIRSKVRAGHWKAATRKLKTLKRRHATLDRQVPVDVYVDVLKTCATDRLHGARAAEPARKIMEELSDSGHPIPNELGNACVRNCLGDGRGRTHDGFGGVDTALAMLAAMENAPDTTIEMETFSAVIEALSKDGSIEEAILLTKAMVVEHASTPSLETFSALASAASQSAAVEETMKVLTMAKAAGYDLDKIATDPDGRSLLASGLIAAERMDNVALGLRFLTAAQKVTDEQSKRGDFLVSTVSKKARRATLLIHKRAIDKAASEANWKLAVRLFQLMPERAVNPPTSVWRRVVTACAKCEKSRKATAILLDWVKYAEAGKAEKPPLAVFNTVVNACEICGEEELTLTVLESMKKTHNVDGNVITFNIALKRLAKSGNSKACEGIIVGMLQAGIEPTVVSYTTAIAACVQDPKDPAFAYEWLGRMRSRGVKPNLYTYNTALAACLDGKLSSTKMGSTIATEMLADVDRGIALGLSGAVEDKLLVPDSYTKVLSRNLMKQLRENWRSGDIDMAEAKSTIRVPLLKLVDFNSSDAAERVKKELEEKAEMRRKKLAECVLEDDEESCVLDELEIEYSDVQQLHKEGARVAEV